MHSNIIFLIPNSFLSCKIQLWIKLLKSWTLVALLDGSMVPTGDTDGDGGISKCVLILSLHDVQLLLAQQLLCHRITSDIGQKLLSFGFLLEIGLADLVLDFLTFFDNVDVLLNTACTALELRVMAIGDDLDDFLRTRSPLEPNWFWS